MQKIAEERPTMRVSSFKLIPINYGATATAADFGRMLGFLLDRDKI